MFVLVCDDHGRIFVHRRPSTKRVFPSCYDMFVGGVVHAGETYDHTARREATEELGVAHLPPPVPVLRFLYELQGYAWWSAVYRVQCTITVHPPPDEVAWHAFLTEAELQRRLDEWSWYRRLQHSAR